MPNIKDVTDANLQRHLAIIRSAPKDSVIYRANQHLLDDSSSTWGGGGLLDFVGLYWWTTSCKIFLTDFSTINYIEFSANGTGGAAAGFACEVAGAFLVHPSTIGGACNFTLGVAGIAEGTVALTLLSTDGTLYGAFFGNASGLGVAVISGTGSLTVIPPS